MTAVRLAPIDTDEVIAEFSEEQAREMRRLLLENYAERGDPSKLSRKNSFFIKASEIVRILDAKGFEWGQSLDETLKQWACIWMARFITNPRKQRWPRFMPLYVEIY